MTRRGKSLPVADEHRRFLYREPEALQGDIRALGLDIPWQEDFGPLLEPCQVGGRTLTNRMAVHPMEGFDAEDDGSPSELTQRRYRRFAGGGAGLLWCEATAVVEEARSNPHQLVLGMANVGAYEKLVAEARQAAREAMGPSHSPLMILQLTHSGRWSKPQGGRQPLIAHHFPELDGPVEIDEGYPVVTDGELERLQELMVSAAALAASAGFDGVDVKACHGYLNSELLGAHTRPGRFGGPLENRSRFLLETAARIRNELPGLVVTTRMNVYDGLPHPYGFGVDPERRHLPDMTEPLEVLRRMEALGAPLANITLGIPYTNPHLGRPFNKGVPGGSLPPEHPLMGIARFQRVTGELQAALPDLPLVGTGYSWLRHFFPFVGAGALASGRVSVVGLGRMAFAYPDFPRDLAEKGHLDPKKVCVGCSGCSHLMRLGRSTGCIVRDGDTYRLPGKGGGG